VTAFAMNLLGDGVAGTGACAVAQGGTVYCTGLNASGQVGNDSNATATTFTQVPGLANMTQVAVGQAHTCALKNDGSVFCWGDNDNGQIGDGTTVTRFAPVPVTAF
jgi:alpha-tubulin suppressor-like RCC1 family protein